MDHVAGVEAGQLVHGRGLSPPRLKIGGRDDDGCGYWACGYTRGQPATMIRLQHGYDMAMKKMKRLRHGYDMAKCVCVLQSFGHQRDAIDYQIDKTL